MAPMALADRDAIMAYIARDKARAGDRVGSGVRSQGGQRPKPADAVQTPQGRVKGTRELHHGLPRVSGDVLEILRVLPRSASNGP
jgi:hypothetical protein